MLSSVKKTENKNGVTLREATERDLPGILQITNEIILSSTAIYEDDPTTLEALMETYRQRTGAGYPYFVAEHIGRIIGFCTYGPFRARVGYRTSVENSLHVTAGQRGKGVGNAMLAHLIEHAKRRGYHMMIAGIDASNEMSIHLHEKHGFVVTARMPEVARKFDRWLDLVLMQRKLV